MSRRSFNNGNHRSPFNPHQYRSPFQGLGMRSGPRHSTPPPHYFQESGPSGFTSPPPAVFSPNQRSSDTPPGGSPNYAGFQQRTPRHQMRGYHQQRMNNSGPYRTPSPFAQNNSGRYSSYNDSGNRGGRRSFNDSRRGGSFNRGRGGGAGGSDNIEDYYKESMVQDPWARFNLDEVKKTEIKVAE